MLSPTLFIVFIDDFIETLIHTNKGIPTEAGILTHIPCIMFVDDLQLMASDAADLNLLIDAVIQHSKQHGYIISMKKKATVLATIINGTHKTQNRKDTPDTKPDD